MYVCTLLNAFLMVITNMDMKFPIFDIFYKNCYIINMTSAFACRMDWSSVTSEMVISARYIMLDILVATDHSVNKNRIKGTSRLACFFL